MALSIRDYKIVRLKSPGLWNKFVLDCIGKGVQLFKFTGKFIYLGMENSYVNVENLGNKAREITACVYLLSITGIANSVQQI